MVTDEIRNVPTTNTENQLFGHGLLTAEGRGVVDGRPYGQQLETEKREMTSQYRFQPMSFGKLRAATRKALGR